MRVDKATALAQIDAVFKRRKDMASDWYRDNVQQIITLARAAIMRLAPPGSAYLDQMERVCDDKMRELGLSKDEVIAEKLQGILMALRADYEADQLQTFTELIHANVFSDFLEMAEYFLDGGYKDPAAVMAGGVLEEHLRKLCAKHGVPLPPNPNLNKMNADLAKVPAYNKNEEKQVTAWAAIRNDAAHGHYANVRVEEVKLMVAGIRDFITRNPA